MKSKLELRISLSPKTTPSPKTNGSGSKKLEPKLTPRPQAKLTRKNSTNSATPSWSTSNSAKQWKKKSPHKSLMPNSIPKDQKEMENWPISDGKTILTTTSPLTGFNMENQLNIDILLSHQVGSTIRQPQLDTNGTLEPVTPMLKGKSWLESQQRPRTKFMKLKVKHVIVFTSLLLLHP